MSYSPVTACIVARDEESVIGDAVRSVDFAAEIVVVIDARTTDRTREAVEAAVSPGQAVRVLTREWRGHVDQKNAAVGEAGQEWVLGLDADERVSPELRREIVALLASGPRGAGYTVPRRTSYLGRWIRHGGWYPDRKLRLFRRERGRWSGDDPHDRVVVDGATGALDGHLVHLGYEDVRSHLEKMRTYAAISARSMRERGVRMPVPRMLVNPIAKFVKMYLLRRGFLDGFPGLAVAVLGSLSVFLKYAALWELIEEERALRKSGAVPDGAGPDGAE